MLGKSNPAALLDTANSKNITAVSEPVGGDFCITTSVPVHIGTGSPNFHNGAVPGTTVALTFTNVDEDIAKGICPPGTNVLVQTGAAGKEESTDFWMTFIRGVSCR